MPSKKKKYNARFPAGRIKKIMQTDEEVGKVAQAVPVIIYILFLTIVLFTLLGYLIKPEINEHKMYSLYPVALEKFVLGNIIIFLNVNIPRTLELFVESLLTKSMQITQARNAKTLTPSHMKQCILSESRFDFLKDLVKSIPDASVQEDNENNAIFEESSETKTDDSMTGKTVEESLKVESSDDESEEARCSTNYTIERLPHTVVSPSQTDSNQQSSSTSRTPVIQYGPKIVQAENTRFNFSVNSLLGQKEEPKLHITIASEQLPVPQLVPASKSTESLPPRGVPSSNIPPLIPLSHYNQNASDNLCIDEDYDN